MANLHVIERYYLKIVIMLMENKMRLFFSLQSKNEHASKLQEKYGKKPYVNLDSKWEEMKMSQICPLIKRWQAATLSLIRSKVFSSHKNIIKQISLIQFNSLEYIKLNSNEIESIQGLHRIRMPALQNIFLCKNRISTVREFRKNSWNLKFISIRKNQLTDARDIARMQTKKLQKLFLDMYSEEKNDPKRITIQDISWVCKLSKLSYLSVYKKLKIQQNAVNNLLIKNQIVQRLS